MSAPVFTHDCDVCRFLGHVEGCDLYVCGGENPMLLTVLARFGSFGPDYSSAPVDVIKSSLDAPASSMRKLLRRAVELVEVQS